MLQLTGYAFDGNFTYSKNGHTINDGDITRYQDAEWMQIIQSHKTPKEASNPFATGTTTRTPSYPTNPFAQADPTANPFASAQPQEESVQEIPNAFSEMAQVFSESDQHISAERPEEIMEVDNSSNLVTQWSEEVPFVEFVLNKSTLRLYPFENQTIALEIPNRDERHMYSGVSQENGLCYIMYKNV